VRGLSEGLVGKVVDLAITAKEKYRRWVETYDTLDDADRAAIVAHAKILPFHPVISVILPAGDASHHPEQSIRSVLRQLYPYWKLYIVENSGPRSATVTLDDSAKRDVRVRLVRTETDGDVAAAGNTGLQAATGQFVTFLQSGDLLPEHALYEVAVQLGADTWADLVYTDEDWIDAVGQRSDPWFKPGWDPDLLLAHDYVGHLAVYRRILVETVGGLRSGLAGAEHYDLALRATAATTPDRVRHIPAICYHRRGGDGMRESRPATAVRRALRDHLDAQGETGAVIELAPLVDGCCRVVWPLPEPAPLVSVIVPTRDRSDLLEECVHGVLHRTDYTNLELIVVDNDSHEPSTLALLERLAREDSRVRVLRHPGPFNYAALNNAAAREARGAVLLLLNNDVDMIERGWLRELVSQAVRLDVGAVGAKLLYDDGRVQHGGIVLGPNGAAIHVHRLASRNDPGYFGQLAVVRSLSAVTGACMAIRRSVFMEVGGLDETNLPVSLNDVDLCLRLADHGYRVVWTPFAELFHLESATRGPDIDSDRYVRFQRELANLRTTWGALMETADPFHNPNLLFSWDHFEVPSVPRREKPWRRSSETQEPGMVSCFAPHNWLIPAAKSQLHFSRGADDGAE
jgi:GT2 family glycosyltransferase